MPFHPKPYSSPMSENSFTMLDAQSHSSPPVEDADNRVVEVTENGIPVRRASVRDQERLTTENNLNFSNSHLSKDHAIISLIGGKVMVKDNNSTFGTTINDDFLIPDYWFELKDQDTLGFIVSKPSKFVYDVHQKFISNDNHLIPLSEFAHAQLGLKFKVDLNGNVLTLSKISNGHKSFKSAMETSEVTDTNGAFDSDNDIEEVRREHKERLLEVQQQLRSLHKAKQEEKEQKSKQLATASEMFDRYQSILDDNDNPVVLSTLVAQDNLEHSEDDDYLEPSSVEDVNEGEDCYFEESEDEVEEYPILKNDPPKTYPYLARSALITDVDVPPYYKTVSECNKKEDESDDGEYQNATEEEEEEEEEEEDDLEANDVEIECCGTKAIRIVDGNYRPYKPLYVLDVETPYLEDAEDSGSASEKSEVQNSCWHQVNSESEGSTSSESDSDYESETEHLFWPGNFVPNDEGVTGETDSSWLSESDSEATEVCWCLVASCWGTCSPHLSEEGDISVSDSKSQVSESKKRTFSDLSDDSDTAVSEPEEEHEEDDHVSKKQKPNDSPKYKLLKEIGKGVLYSVGTIIALGIYGSTLDGSDL